MVLGAMIATCSNFEKLWGSSVERIEMDEKDIRFRMVLNIICTHIRISPSADQVSSMQNQYFPLPYFVYKNL